MSALDISLAAVLIVGAVALVLAPLVLPWQWELRWIVASESVNPLIAVSNAVHHVQLEEVVLVDFATTVGVLRVVVEPEGTDGGGRTELVGEPCSTGDLAALDGWRTGRTPLLLVEEDGGAASLRGPHRAISGLHELHSDPAPLRS